MPLSICIPSGWISRSSSELEKRWKKPVRVANDAAVQGYGAIKGHGVELILTLGTGMGSALFTDGKLCPGLELGHHPWREKDLRGLPGPPRPGQVRQESSGTSGSRRPSSRPRPLSTGTISTWAAGIPRRSTSSCRRMSPSSPMKRAFWAAWCCGETEDSCQPTVIRVKEHQHFNGGSLRLRAMG